MEDITECQICGDVVFGYYIKGKMKGHKAEDVIMCSKCHKVYGEGMGEKIKIEDRELEYA